MACNSLKNTALHLRNKVGIIDRANRVSPENLSKMEDIIARYTLAALQEYGVNEGNLFTIKETKVKQVGGHNNHRDNTRTHFVLEPNVKAFEAIDDIKESIEASFAPEESSDGYDYLIDGYSGDMITPHFTKYIRYKRNQIVRLEKALFKTKKAKKDNKDNASEFRRLVALEAKLELLLNGDEDTLSLAEKLDEMENAGFFGLLEDTALQDLKLAEELADSDDFADLIMAKETVEIYRRFGNFDVNDNDNPLYNFNNPNDVFYDSEGNLAIDDNIVESLSRIGNLAEVVSNKLARNDRAVTENLITNYSKIKRLGLDLTYEDLFPTQGIKDINIFDAYMMDMTNGVLSDNGLVAKFAQSYLEDAINKSSYKSRVISEHLDNISSDVTKKLRSIKGGKYKMGLRGASYDYFRQVDSNGNFTGETVKRYSNSFNKAIAEINRKYFSDRKEAYDSFANKNSKLAKASKKRDEWLRKNGKLLDLNNLQFVYDILGTTPGSKFDPDYEKNLIKEIGQLHFDELKKESEAKIKEYKAQKEVAFDNAMVEEGVSKPSDLSKKGQIKLAYWVRDNSPLRNVNKFKVKEPTGLMTYNTFIPTNPDFYDETYKEIEADKDLLSFHKVLIEFKDQVDELPDEPKRKIFKNGLPSMDISIAEIFQDKNTPILIRISKAYKRLIRDIMDLFTEIRQGTEYKGMVNPITGKPDYKVSDDFLKDNQEQIKLMTDIYMVKLGKALGSTVLSRGYKLDISKLHPAIKPEVIGILTELYKVKDFEALKKRLPNTDLTKPFDLNKMVYEGVKHNVIVNETSDLPKIIKFYTKMISEYQARNEALPILQTIKEKYENIDNVATTKEGNIISNIFRKSNGLEESKQRKDIVNKRAKAVKQIDTWFHRAVLGNYSSRFEYGDGILEKKYLNKDEKAILKLLKEQELELGQAIEDKNKELKNINPIDDWGDSDVLAKDIAILENALKINKIRQEKLGKNYSAKKGLESLMKFMRFKGLGYNLNSYLTNFFEGQTANFFAAASGDYFSPELIYRANKIMSESTLKGISGGKLATRDAKVTRILMDRYDIMQDATNELQKASNNSAIGSLSVLAPMAGTQKVEYVNQAPIMLGVLMDHMIEGKDGRESSVFDAFKSDGQLKDNFNTEKHRNNWVDGLGQDFLDKKAVISKAIVNTHGDYHNLRGNMASEYATGKALLMFKRWMSRQIYNRFGASQIDLEANIKDFKGRYRSHDKVSGGLHAGIAAFAGLSIIGAGLPGLAIGGLVGAGIGAFTRRNESNLTMSQSLRELAFLSREIIITPFKRTANTLLAFGNINIKDADYAKRLPNYSSRDIKNIRVNVVEMSMMLMRMAMILIAKSFLWDDEDDEESKRRRSHNLLVNKLMTLSSSLGMYSNPAELYRAINDPALLGLFDDVKKASYAFSDYWNGNDTTLSGDNAGKSKLAKATRKVFLPKLIADPMNLGFGSQIDRQFQPTNFDSMFWGEEKVFGRKNKALRAIYKEQLISQGVDKDFASELVKERYPSKKSGRSQQEWYEEIKDNPKPSEAKVRRDITNKARKKAIKEAREKMRQENIRKYKESLK